VKGPDPLRELSSFAVWMVPTIVVNLASAAAVLKIVFAGDTDSGIAGVGVGGAV
jgi:hypothetical protein